MIWLRRNVAVNHPYAVDKMLVNAGLCQSLTAARRAIADGSIYVKLIPPEKNFLPVIVATSPIRLDEYVALGITPELAEKILNEARDVSKALPTS
jgi:predicted rRNA methylase YqxC with S4 and FtsJ domains